MNLSAIRQRCLDVFHANQVPGKPYGCVRPIPNGEPDFYSSADWAIIRTIWGEDLRKTLSDAQRKAWVGYLASQVDPSDGSVPILRGHSKLHANGTAIGAFGALGGRMPVPVRLYEPFAEPARVVHWLENSIDWSKIWGESHLFWGGMHCFALSSTATPAWREAVFNWLDSHLDPKTGWWCKGIAYNTRNDPLGGAVHILPIYQHLDRPFPFPERLIDSTLEMQYPEGNWMRGDWLVNLGFTYLDLDGLYALDVGRKWAPGYRTADIEAATKRHADLIEPKIDRELDRAFAQHPHIVLSIIGTLGLSQRFHPRQFHDDRQWTDIFSDPALYRVKESEPL